MTTSVHGLHPREAVSSQPGQKARWHLEVAAHALLLREAPNHSAPATEIRLVRKASFLTLMPHTALTSVLYPRPLPSSTRLQASPITQVGGLDTAL